MFLGAAQFPESLKTEEEVCIPIYRYYIVETKCSVFAIYFLNHKNQSYTMKIKKNKVRNLTMPEKHGFIY